MDQPQKNQLRLVTSSGNAFEALTTMGATEVADAHAHPDDRGMSTFTCFNERDELVVLQVKAEMIEGIMMQRHNKVRT